LPEASTAAPAVSLSSAVATGPFVLPLLPATPPTVVATPLGVTLRTVLLYESAT
jgi:hypothetical protein